MLKELNGRVVNLNVTESRRLDSVIYNFYGNAGVADSFVRLIIDTVLISNSSTSQIFKKDTNGNFYFMQWNENGKLVYLPFILTDTNYQSKYLVFTAFSIGLNSTVKQSELSYPITTGYRDSIISYFSNYQIDYSSFLKSQNSNRVLIPKIPNIVDYPEFGEYEITQLFVKRSMDSVIVRGYYHDGLVPGSKDSIHYSNPNFNPDVYPKYPYAPNHFSRFIGEDRPMVRNFVIQSTGSIN